MYAYIYIYSYTIIVLYAYIYIYTHVYTLHTYIYIHIYIYIYLERERYRERERDYRCIRSQQDLMLGGPLLTPGSPMLGQTTPGSAAVFSMYQELALLWPSLDLSSCVLLWVWVWMSPGGLASRTRGHPTPGTPGAMTPGSGERDQKGLPCTRLVSHSAPAWSSRCCFAACHFLFGKSLGRKAIGNEPNWK